MKNKKPRKVSKRLMIMSAMASMAGLTFIRPYVPNAVLPKDYISATESYDGYTYGVSFDTPYLHYSTPGTINERSPDTMGWYAVWQRLTDKGWQIIFYNAEESKAYQVTDEADDQTNPQTDGKIIVWQGNQEDGIWNVYMYDTSKPESGIVKLNTSGPAMRPRVSKGIVVWQQWLNKNWEIAAWRDGEVFVMTNDLKPDIEPDIFYDMLVWTRTDPGPINRVITKDLRTGDEAYLDSKSRGQIRPRFLNDGTLHWYAFEDEGYVKREYNFLTDVESKEIIMTSESLKENGISEEPQAPPTIDTNIIDIPVQDLVPQINPQLEQPVEKTEPTIESAEEPATQPESIPATVPEPAPVPADEPQATIDNIQNASDSMQMPESPALNI